MTGFRDVRRLGESAANAVLERVGRGMSKVQERKPLEYDLLESEDAYLIVFDALWATSSDIDVRLLDGEIKVQVDRFREYYEGFEMRFPGRGLALDGRAQLPVDAAIEPDDVTARLRENGSLQVRVPKSDDGKTIDIEEAS
jgi:HSP20 family molecular chaperone IbpA